MRFSCRNNKLNWSRTQGEVSGKRWTIKFNELHFIRRRRRTSGRTSQLLVILGQTASEGGAESRKEMKICRRKWALTPLSWPRHQLSGSLVPLVKSHALISRPGGGSVAHAAISSLSTAAEHRTNNKYCKQFVWPGWGNRKPWQIFAHAPGRPKRKSFPPRSPGGGVRKTKGGEKWIGGPHKPFGAINYHHQQMAMWFILSPLLPQQTRTISNCHPAVRFPIPSRIRVPIPIGIPVPQVGDCVLPRVGNAALIKSSIIKRGVVVGVLRPGSNGNCIRICSAPWLGALWTS